MFLPWFCYQQWGVYGNCTNSFQLRSFLPAPWAGSRHWIIALKEKHHNFKKCLSYIYKWYPSLQSGRLLMDWYLFTQFTFLRIILSFFLNPILLVKQFSFQVLPKPCPFFHFVVSYISRDLYVHHFSCCYEHEPHKSSSGMRGLILLTVCWYSLSRRESHDGRFCGGNMWPLSGHISVVQKADRKEAQLINLKDSFQWPTSST